MSQYGDRKECSRSYGVENTNNDAVGFMEEGVEKQSLLTATDKEQHRKNLLPGCVPKLFIVLVLGSFLPLLWMLHGLLHDCMPVHKFATEQVDDKIVSTTFHLVKNAISATTGVLETFQVYQPVFTPSGAIDETTSPSGFGITTTIAQTAPSTSCSVVLMDHSFGYSYGMPFVGKSTKPVCSTILTSLSRILHSSSMQIQQGYDELHRHLQGPPIRPVGPDVLRRH